MPSSDVVVYKLSLEAVKRDFLQQLDIDYLGEFERDDSTRYLLSVHDGAVHQPLLFPAVDGVTDLVIVPQDHEVTVFLGVYWANEGKKVPGGSMIGYLGNEPYDPLYAASITYNPGDGSIAHVLVYYAGEVGVAPTPVPPPPEGVLVETGSFTITGHGFISNPTGTAKWTKIDPLITIFIPDLAGVSNATTFTLTGLPSNLAPVNTESFLARITDNDEEVVGEIVLTGASLVIDVFSGFAGGPENPFIDTGGKSLKAMTVVYQKQ